MSCSTSSSARVLAHAFITFCFAESEEEICKMSEPNGNVRWVCPDHGPKSGGFADQDPTTMVGRFVKRAFPAIHPQTQEPVREHMWVKVLSVENGQLKGLLDNHPSLSMELRLGDTVMVSMDEIEDVL